ncbi:hypothetical protein FCX66_20700 [Escherichia coli]|nr:hypothetical protein [Escherichia coli]
MLCHGTVCVVGKIRDLILQLSKSSIYSTKPNSATLDQWNGKDSTMTVKQFGGGNGAAVDQTASNSSVNVTQVGFGNNATAHQY